MANKFGRARMQFSDEHIQRLGARPTVTDVANALLISKSAVFRWIREQPELCVDAPGRPEPCVLSRARLLEFLKSTGRFRRKTEYD
jgi:hypothetical protein